MDAEKVIVEIDADLEEIVPEYLEMTRQDVVKIRGALDNGDFETIRIVGHTLKGSGGGYGFDRLTEIGRHLEQGAKRGDAAEIRRQVEEMVAYLDRVEVTYR